MEPRVDERLHAAWSHVMQAITDFHLGASDFRSHRLGYVNTQAEAIANDLRKVESAIYKLREEVRQYDNRRPD